MKDSLIKLIKNTNKVRFEISGLGAETYDTLYFKEEIEELERFTLLGKAIEKVLETDGNFIFIRGKEYSVQNTGDLLNWYARNEL